MVIKTPQVKTILNDPAEAARLINLVYVTNSKLTIKRHRRGKGFYYTKDGSKIVDKEANLWLFPLPGKRLKLRI